jgi:nucleoside-triphosphatase
MKNIFITGKPKSGKTTLLKEIIEKLKLKSGGFYTEEIQEKGKRKGFKIITLKGKSGILAHQDIGSPYRVGKYKVNIKNLEEIGVNSILEALKENKIVVIDEIGKMELFSEKFKKAVEIALNSKNKVLGTIKLTPDPFSEKIKKRKDIKIFHLNRLNREKIKKEIIKLLS